MEELTPSVSPEEVTKDSSAAPTVEELKAKLTQEMNEVITWVLSCRALTFFEFEIELVSKVQIWGGLLVQLFLCMRQEQFQAAQALVVGARV